MFSANDTSPQPASSLTLYVEPTTDSSWGVRREGDRRATDFADRASALDHAHQLARTADEARVLTMNSARKIAVVENFRRHPSPQTPLRHKRGCDGGFDGSPCSCGLDDELLQLGLYEELGTPAWQADRTSAA